MLTVRARNGAFVPLIANDHLENASGRPWWGNTLRMRIHAGGSTLSGREVVQRMCDAIRRRDTLAYAALFAPDGVLEDPLFDKPITGFVEIARAEQALLAPFEAIDPRIERMLAIDEVVIAEVALRARHTRPVDVGLGDPLPPSFERVELPLVWVLELTPDGLIAHERDYFDTGLLFWQLSLGV